MNSSMFVDRLVLTDRSKIEDRWHCPRLFYWNHVAEGHGWQRQPSIDMLLGTMVHNAIESSMDGEFQPSDLPPITEEMLGGFAQWTPEQAERILDFATEVVALTYSESRAWANVTDGVIVGCRAELEFEHKVDDVVYQARPDLLFELAGGHHRIVNIKTSSGASEWQKWGIQPAIIGEFYAVSAKLPLGASWVFHVNKGQKMSPKGVMTYFTSPLFVGYKKGDNIIAGYKPGHDRVWLWEHFNAQQWALKLTTEFKDEFEAIYEVSGPHLPSMEQLAIWRDAIVREGAAPHGDQINEYPQHFGRGCVWPNQCSAFDFCFGMASLDPAACGFEARRPNHPLLQIGVPPTKNT